MQSSLSLPILLISGPVSEVNVEVPPRTEISAVAIDEAGLLIGFLSLDFLNPSKEYLLRSPALRKTPALHKSGEVDLGGISIVLTMYNTGSTMLTQHQRSTMESK